MAAPPSPGSDAGRTGDVVHEALVLLQRYSTAISHVAENALGPMSTGNTDIGVLLAIHAVPGPGPADVGRMVDAPRSTVARALARLVAAGLVERRTNAVDRRRTRLTLTRRGRRGVDRLERLLEEHFHDGEALAKEFFHVLGRRPARSGDSSARSTFEVAAGLSRAGEAARADVESAARPFGLDQTVERYAMLVVARSDIRPSQLSDELLLTPTGTSSLLDRLAARGLVTRVSGAVEGDGRAVLVRATPSGRRAAGAIVQAYVPHLDSLADALEQTMWRG